MSPKGKRVLFRIVIEIAGLIAGSIVVYIVFYGFIKEAR